MATITLTLGGTITRDEVTTLALALSQHCPEDVAAIEGHLQAGRVIRLPDAEYPLIQRLRPLLEPLMLSSATYWSVNGNACDEALLYDARSKTTRSLDIEGSNVVIRIGEAFRPAHLRSIVAWDFMRTQLALTIVDTAHERAALALARRNGALPSFMPDDAMIDALIARNTNPPGPSGLY